MVRHRVQRLVKEVFRLYAPHIETGYDVVVLIHKNVRIEKASGLSFRDMEQLLLKPMEQAKLLKKKMPL